MGEYLVNGTYIPYNLELTNSNDSMIEEFTTMELINFINNPNNFNNINIDNTIIKNVKNNMIRFISHEVIQKLGNNITFFNVYQLCSLLKTQTDILSISQLQSINNNLTYKIELLKILNGNIPNLYSRDIYHPDYETFCLQRLHKNFNGFVKKLIIYVPYMPEIIIRLISSNLIYFSSNKSFDNRLKSDYPISDINLSLIRDYSVFTPQQVSYILSPQKIPIVIKNGYVYNDEPQNNPVLKPDTEPLRTLSADQINSLITTTTKTRFFTIPQLKKLNLIELDKFSKKYPEKYNNFCN